MNFRLILLVGALTASLSISSDQFAFAQAKIVLACEFEESLRGGRRSSGFNTFYIKYLRDGSITIKVEGDRCPRIVAQRALDAEYYLYCEQTLPGHGDVVTTHRISRYTGKYVKTFSKKVGATDVVHSAGRCELAERKF